jgi:predicted nucleic acid-binding protein
MYLPVSRLITTEVVLIEFLNYFCGYGSVMRQVAVNSVEKILQNPTVEVIPLTHESFVAGLQFYRERLDKGYSLTDCISMIVMKQADLTEVLTHNRHFSQEGFQILL